MIINVICLKLIVVSRFDVNVMIVDHMGKYRMNYTFVITSLLFNQSGIGALVNHRQTLIKHLYVLIIIYL